MLADARISDYYRERITCFIDILGFSRDVAQIDSNPALFLSVDAGRGKAVPSVCTMRS
jgi:hypothetical protein